MLVANDGALETAAAYDGMVLTISAPKGFAVAGATGCDNTVPVGSVVTCDVKAEEGKEPLITFTVISSPSDLQPQTITLHAGWNLVGFPVGTSPETDSTLAFGFDANASQYVPVSPNDIQAGGDGYWLYTPVDSVQEIPNVGPISAFISVPAGKFVLVGNPGQAPVSLVDAALYVFDTDTGQYQLTQLLQPGQGAWAYSRQGGTMALDSGIR